MIACRKAVFLAVAVGLSFQARSTDISNELSRAFAPFQAGNSSFVEIFEEVAEADRAADRAWRQLKTQAEYDACRTAMKAKMIAAIGGLPEKTPLGAKVTKTYRRDGYTVEKVLFQSSPGVYVTGQFYRPDDTRFKPPFPAVVVSCGHAGEGMACYCYQRACVDLAKRGICGFIFEAMGQGERKQDGEMRNTQAHNAIGVPAMLLGGSMAQLRIWDGIRAIDYVVSRPDVDGARIGYEGQSGGGTMTALMMAVDDRIRAAAPSCYLTNLRELADHMGPQDAEQNIFGQLAFGLNHLGFILMQDIPVMVVCKKQDGFSYCGTDETFDQLMEVAATLGKTDRYFKCAQPGPHGWIESTRAASALWMGRWLQGAKESIDLMSLRLLDYGRNFDKDMCEGREDGGLPMDDGYVTPNASVLELPGAKSIFTIMDEKLERIERTRKSLSADGKRNLMRSFAKVRTAAEANCRVVPCGETRSDGVTVKRFLVCHPKGLNLPAVLLMPEEAEGAPALVVHPKGRGAAADEVVKLLAAKRPVLAIDCLGTGEVGGSKHLFYGASDTPEEGLAVMLYWLGDSLVARRATDLLVAADLCAKQTGAKPELIAFGTYAVPAAHAFAADRDAFSGVTLREPSKTWADMVRSHVRERFETCVNGALLHYDWPELLK